MDKTDRQQNNFKGNNKHLSVLLDALEREKIRLWNDWRLENSSELPDLKGINLIGENLVGINLIGADLSGADLSKANLSTAELSGVILVGQRIICIDSYVIKIIPPTNARLIAVIGGIG